MPAASLIPDEDAQDFVVDDGAAADGGKVLEDLPLSARALAAIMNDAATHTREEAGS